MGNDLPGSKFKGAGLWGFGDEAGSAPQVSGSRSTYPLKNFSFRFKILIFV